MKKLIFASILALGCLTAINAQDKITDNKALVTTTDDVQDYEEVNVSKLPQPVKDAVAKDFEGATITKAFTNAKGEFKLVIATADALSKTVYANRKGEWIKKQ